MELFFTDDEFILNKKVFKKIPFIVDKNMKLVDVVNNYLFYIAVTNGKTESPKTWETYGRNLCDYFGWLEIQELEWCEVKEHHIGAYRNAMQINLSSLTGRPNCVSTINQRLGQVVRFYGYLFNKNLIGHIPYTTREVNLRNTGGLLAHTGASYAITTDLMLKSHEQLHKYLPLEELSRFINLGFVNERAKLMSRVMLQTGMRRQEITLLPVCLIEEAENKVKNESYGNVIPLELPKEICKNKKSRTVFISRDLLSALRQYRILVRPSLDKKFQKQFGRKSNKFWLSAFGFELNTNCLNRDFEEASKRAGIFCTPHMMRHTFATHFYIKTNNLRALQKLLGHSSITTTQKYEHSTPNHRLGFMDDFQTEIDGLFIKGK